MNEVKVEQISDDLYTRRNKYRRLGDIQVIIDADFEVTVNGALTIIVPKGFRCDLASIPSVGRAFISKMEGSEAAVVHDYLYFTGKYPRKFADRVFQAMLRYSVSGWKVAAMYRAVRLFGGSSWSTHRARDKQK